MKKLNSALVFLFFTISFNLHSQPWNNYQFAPNPAGEEFGNNQVSYTIEDYICVQWTHPVTSVDYFITPGSIRDNTTGQNLGKFSLIKTEKSSSTFDRIGPIDVNTGNPDFDTHIEVKQMLVEGDYLYVLIGLWLDNQAVYPLDFYSYGVLEIDLTDPLPFQVPTSYREVYPSYDGCAKFEDLCFRKQPGGDIFVGYTIRNTNVNPQQCGPQVRGIQVDRIDVGGAQLGPVEEMTYTYYSSNSVPRLESIEFNNNTGNLFMISSDLQNAGTNPEYYINIMEMDASSPSLVPIVSSQTLYLAADKSHPIENFHTSIDESNNTVYVGFEGIDSRYTLLGADFNINSAKAIDLHYDPCQIEPTAIRNYPDGIQIAGITRNCSAGSNADEPIIHSVPYMPSWGSLTSSQSDKLINVNVSYSDNFDFADFIIDDDPLNDNRYLFGYRNNVSPTGKDGLNIYNFDNPASCPNNVSLIQSETPVKNVELGDDQFYYLKDDHGELDRLELDTVVAYPEQIIPYGCGIQGTPFKKDPTTSNALINQVDKSDQYEVKVYDLMGRNVLNFTTAELSTKKDIRMKVKRKVRNELSNSQVLIIKAKGKTTNESITYKEVFIQ
ncbi:hypothetical protein [Salibacter halophilus]|uniref:T9SS type A sorting domain-containing protein n=1 Tax=Salibacter halophilus TaxID=1803916 RepID=A0A6N6M5X2_9FLAO|nr:hypothetical protein [Salibacter halophilus]KAB1064923.1 hypothetical protein F3059_06100 [Salibacter halophilus]